MRRRSLLGCFVAAPALALAAGPRRSATSEPSIEERDLVRALRSIEARTEVGMNQAALNNVLGDLAVAVSAFNDSRMADAKLRASASAVLEPFKDAQVIWTACTQGCAYGFIVLDGNIEPALEKFAAGLLDAYPAMRASTTDGGVLDGRRIFYRRMISHLLTVGSDRARALRETITR